MRHDSRHQPAKDTRWADVFVCLTSALLVLIAVWSLGGRAEGAIELIGILAWAGSLILIFTPAFDPAWARRETWVPWLAWVGLLPLLVIAPLNASSTVVTEADGSVVLQSLTHLSFFPSALIYERCREYSLLLSGLLLFVMVLWHCLKSTAQIRRLVTVLAANAFFAAIVGSYFQLSGSERILGLFEPVHSGFFASFRYHNHWTAFALLSMGQCLAMGIYWFRRCRADADANRRRPDIFWFAGLLILSLTLPMTTARAGVLFLVLFWLVLGGWLLLGTSNKKGVKPVHRMLICSLVVIGSVAVVAYGIWGSRSDLVGEWEQSVRQMEQLKAGEYRDIEWARTDSWGDGWRMLQDRPIWGWGFGSHRYLYQLYARDEYRYESGVVKHIKEFAHNDWMQYLAELGVVGFLLLIGPPLALLYRFRAGIARSEFTQALLFPLGLILLLATFEFPLSNPAVLVLFFVQLALGLRVASLSSGSVSPSPTLSTGR